MPSILTIDEKLRANGASGELIEWFEAEKTGPWQDLVTRTDQYLDRHAPCPATVAHLNEVLMGSESEDFWVGELNGLLNLWESLDHAA